MGNQNIEIETLLNRLDKSVNSNSAWLHFNINATDGFNVNTFLVNQLRSGYFHSALVESDIVRGWNHYVNLIFPENPIEPVVRFQKQGNTWNGNEHLDLTEISAEQAKDFVIDLLTGEQKFFSRSALGTQLDVGSASVIFENFIAHIQGLKSKHVTFYTIKPNFLSTIEEYYQSDFTKPGYFEDAGCDFVLGILLHEKESDTLEWGMLMTNGYS